MTEEQVRYEVSPPPPEQLLEEATARVGAALDRLEAGPEGSGRDPQVLADLRAAHAALIAYRRAQESEPGRIRLRRTGQSDLEFEGALMARVTSRGDEEQPRWYEAAVYRRAQDGYVLAFMYRTKWKGELDYDDAMPFERLEDLKTMVRTIDPVGRVQGFPPGPQFAEKQARLLASLRQRWEALVSELLAQLRIVDRIA